MGRIVFPASPLSEENICRLDEECFCRLGHAPLNVELPEEAGGRQLVNWMNHCVRYGHSSWEDFLVSSLDLPVLGELRQLQPQLRTGWIIGDGLDHSIPTSPDGELRDAGVSCLIPSLSSLRSLALALAERRTHPELRVLAKTVSGPDEARSAVRWGVDGVICDEPEEVRRLVAVASEWCPQVIAGGSSAQRRSEAISW